MMRRLLVCCLLVTSSCADFPRDPDGTLDRIRAEQRFSVGLVAPLEQNEPKVAELLARVGRAAGATPRIEQGDAEPLLNRLKEGEIDLVVGRFDKKTPWGRLVTLGPPLRIEAHGKAEFHLAPVMANGENAWIALVERESRGTSPEAQ